MLSIHERVSKQDESEREIEEEIIEKITALAKGWKILAFRHVLLSLSINASNRWTTGFRTGVVTR